MGTKIVQILAATLFLATSQAQDATAVAAPESSSPPISTTRKREVIKATPGPWGSLEYYQIPLECPREYLNFLTTPSQQVAWHFAAKSREELDTILLKAGLTSVEISMALKGASILNDPEAMRVFPTDDAILGISHETRVKLYHLLARSDGNRYYQRPIYIDSENLSYWFEGSSVPRSAIQDVAKLAYPTPHGRGYFLADLPFTLRQASTALEERQLLVGLLRQQGLIVRLRLTRDSLSPEIADYWNAGYKNKAVMPILESVVQANDGGAIDIAHLLPATPRQYLNRFPTPADGVHGRFPDWFWTCYNFFRFAPREIYADSPEREALIFTEFERSLPPLQFGDMLLLNSGNKIIHGCIFVADDIAFTKNGADLFSPWVLMKIEDIVAYHDLVGDVTLSVFRKLQPAP